MRPQKKPPALHQALACLLVIAVPAMLVVVAKSTLAQRDGVDAPIALMHPQTARAVTLQSMHDNLPQVFQLAQAMQLKKRSNSTGAEVNDAKSGSSDFGDAQHGTRQPVQR